MGKVYVGSQRIVYYFRCFYEASEEVEPKLYDPNWYRFKGTDPNEIDFYKYGVITYSENSYIDEDWPDFNSIYAPLKSEDLAHG